MITPKTESVVKLLNNMLDEAVRDGGDSGGAYYGNTNALDVAVNNLLYAIGLSQDYETKIIEHCIYGSDVKIIEKHNAFKISDF